MAELKNTFQKGKMNKDLDKRIIPNGEYIDAQNILINDSEDSNVGAIENIRGNKIAHGNLSASINSVVIGYHSDVATKKVFWFITDFTEGDTGDVINMKRADVESGSFVCKVVMMESDGSLFTLASGEFLNFSTNHLITGINLLDDLLFWTDNYNQPRKINITTAKAGATYYSSEEKISVAKIAPYMAPVVVNTSGVTQASNESTIKSDYLQENFVRFSYRYKYEDGEYSTMAPFTQIMFKPLNDGAILPHNDQVNATSAEPNVTTSAEDLYKKGTVDIMENAYNKIILRIPLPNADEFKTSAYSPVTTYANTYKISEIDILIKESNSVAVKVVGNIEISTPHVGASSNRTDIEQYTIKPKSAGSVTYYRQQAVYTYRSEKPYKTLPEDQTVRVYDQVPVRAKAQEVSSNRIIYGNFTENYNLPKDELSRSGINYIVNASVKGTHEYNKTTGLLQHSEKGYKFNSLKQRRTYQVGVVLADRFGRQSSVMLSSNTDDIGETDTFTLPNDSSDYSNKFSSAYSWSTDELTIGKSLDIEFKDTRIVPTTEIYSATNPNGWYSWRLVVKQTEQEYYNVYASHPADNWNNLDHKFDNTSSGRSWLTLSGDNINKVPRSSDEDMSRDNIAGSNARLFPKVISISSNDSFSIRNTDASSKLIDVISVGNAKDQNLYLQASNSDYQGDDSGTTGFSILPFVHGADRNPIVVEIPNLSIIAGTSNSGGVKASVFTDGTNNVNVMGATTLGLVNGMNITGPTVNLQDINTLLAVSNVGSVTSPGNFPVTYTGGDQAFTTKDILFFSDYKEGLSVFETEPFESQLDIYYETSTGGLVKDLNEQMSEVTGTPSNIQFTSTSSTTEDFPENSNSGTTIGQLTATASGGGALTYQLLSAQTQGGTDVSAKFAVSSSGLVTTAGEFARQQSYNEDQNKLNVRVAESGANSATAILTVWVLNSAPTITSTYNTSSNVPTVSISAVSGVQVFNGTAENGAALSSGDTTGLTFSVNLPGTAYDNYFAVASSSAGNWEVTTTSNFNGSTFSSVTLPANRTITVTVTDAEGLTATKDVRVDVVAAREQSTFSFNGLSSSGCNTGIPGTYYVEQGISGSQGLTASELEVGNIIFDGSTSSVRSSLGYYKFTKSLDGNTYYGTVTTGTNAYNGGLRYVSAITQC